jgi:hypothetical protein
MVEEEGDWTHQTRKTNTPRNSTTIQTVDSAILDWYELSLTECNAIVIVSAPDGSFAATYEEDGSRRPVDKVAIVHEHLLLESAHVAVVEVIEPLVEPQHAGGFRRVGGASKAHAQQEERQQHPAAAPLSKKDQRSCTARRQRSEDPVDVLLDRHRRDCRAPSHA